MVSYPQLPPLCKLFWGSHYWIFIRLVPRLDIYHEYSYIKKVAITEYSSDWLPWLDIYHEYSYIKKVAITEYLSDWSRDSIYIMNIHISRKVGSNDISLLEIEVVLYLESMTSSCIPVYTLCTYIWAILNCRQGTNIY